MPISCIIIDDEEMAVQHLARYVAKVPFLELTAYFTDPSEAVQYLDNHEVDLIFLDVEMPNFSIDGMDFIRLMGDKYNYVFTTAYPQYALPSYEYNAIDFLHKPFGFDRFMKAVQKARQIITASKEQLIGEMEECMYVKSDGRLQRIDYDDICWIESERNYISIFTNTDRITVLMSISDIEQQIPSRRFARVHKSFIIAYKKVEAVEKEQVQIQRHEASKWIPLGELYKKTFLQTIENRTLKKQ